MNYFDHGLANAVLEGMNSVIQSAKRLARGFRNPEYFKTVIYLHLREADLPADGGLCYPLETAKGLKKSY